MLRIDQQGVLPLLALRRLRRAALKSLIVVSALLASRRSSAACTDAAPCVDAEPLWLTPAARRFAVVSDTGRAPFAGLSGSASFGFRWQPALVSVPAPSREGRDVNVLRHATDATLGLCAGTGRGVELTLVLPAGLYQRGSGIKGVTHQSAPPIAQQSLHDPRIGFGFALPALAGVVASKLRFELKLPLGDSDALTGEAGLVASPSIALSARKHGLFAGVELGARLRKPALLYGSRIGSQALLALGIGYELPAPRLSLAVETYALPSLVRAASTRYLPAEWLASLSFSPRTWPRWAFGLAGGTGLAFSSNAGGSSFGFGVPAFRSLLFARFTPGTG
jgi:hypothetical protein